MKPNFLSPGSDHNDAFFIITTHVCQLIDSPAYPNAPIEVIQDD